MVRKRPQQNYRRRLRIPRHGQNYRFTARRINVQAPLSVALPRRVLTRAVPLLTGAALSNASAGRIEVRPLRRKSSSLKLMRPAGSKQLIS
jgi:hypothetical protein